MTTQEPSGSARRTRRRADKVVYQGSGAALLGNNPSVSTQEEADRIVAALLGRTVAPQT